ncbi:phage tail tape measure protein [Pseudomonas monteilii]|uniref:phage tail tape measure protein n=1 Tax=Pseudomonas monteilii TaxID=76759 RepID=UPI001E351867|nr:phage tail tape measure protein [Pseudomonas monteilii]MCE0875956.1 phage tail tape measure protein [Pseudomonas monteilii]MCE0930671.1 phage tail tape measure protein [Pseudomonas monteilii]MCE0977317.1 phage tail tape measure protein [Pseudomonas monteilii]MCE1010848.1 phage tail tape measure protein [Pseudomonas monteilii]MCE1034385.1 phage tail tape measure protein [Pseudomonas monteilii]
MANDLRLQVVLSAINKATAPLRQISQGSQETAQALKAARDTLKELNAQQKDVSAWRTQFTEARKTAEALDATKSRVQELAGALRDHEREVQPLQASYDKLQGETSALNDRHKSLTAQLKQTREQARAANQVWQENRKRIRDLGEQIGKTNQPTEQLRNEYAALVTQQQAQLALVRRLSGSQKELQQQHRTSAAQAREHRERLSGLATQLLEARAPMQGLNQDFRTALREARALKSQHASQEQGLQALRAKLSAAGISTRDLASHERKLRDQISATNEAISAQTKRMDQLAAKQAKLAKARSDLEKAQRLGASMAGTGAVGLATGYAAAQPVKAAIQAFAPNEDSATQLKVSMMGSNGQVAEDFQKITDQATRLGDRLPGTTADFQNMMTVLRKQGISAQSILGGTGEAAAYLGVLLKMPVEASAEFAAKMQDATRTGEKDMMGLMDTIQRVSYLGMDDSDMLQGFSKLSPAMAILRKEGLDAVNTFAPLLVMMDQASMAGESAGNALRKVFQSSLNTKKLGKANDVLKDLGLSLDFSDGKGEFGGIEKLYAQLEKLKTLNSIQRGSVLQELFGDDAETLQVVNTMMDKGLAGYQEVQQKLKDQADLRTRVNEQLGTLSNVMEAAEGSFTNAMAEFGGAVAPELKSLISTLGDIAASVGAWARENPGLAGGLVKVVAAVAVLAAGFGALAITMASLLGPFAMVRYGMTLFSVKGAGVLPVVGKLASVLGGGLLTAIRAVSIALWGLATNPVALAIAAVVAALAGGAYLLYQNWDQVKAYFANSWAEIRAGFGAGIGGILTVLANFSPIGLIYQAFAGVLNYLGIELPTRFTEFGSMIVNGLVNGLLAGLGQIKSAIGNLGDSAIGWFKEKLGIHSPSRVFAELGGFTTEGLAVGVNAGAKAPLDAVARMGQDLTKAGQFDLQANAPEVAASKGLVTSAGSLGAQLAQAGTLDKNFATAGVDQAIPANIVELNSQLAKVGRLDTQGAVPPAGSGQQRPAEVLSLSQQLAKVAPQEVLASAPQVDAGRPTAEVISLSKQLANITAPDVQALVPKVDASRPAAEVISLSKQLTNMGQRDLQAVAPQLGTGQSLAANAAPGITLDSRPPIAGAAPSISDSHDVININIHPAPGMDPQAIARAVSAELDRRNSEKSARQRSRLSDQE